MRLALFPGQGIPAPVVADALPAGDQMVLRASEVLGYDLRKKVAAHARRQQLPTSLAQPAIAVAGLIAHRDSGEFDVYLGHSVGEYTALIAAGAIGFDAGISVLQVRGRAMQRAAQFHPGGMLAVMGLDESQVSDIAVRTGSFVANHNAPLQTVLAGGSQSLAAASAQINRAGGRAVLLPVSGPFHSPAMSSASGPLEEALSRTEVRMPRAFVLSNLSARPYRSPGEVRKLLVQQVASPIQFERSLCWAFNRGFRDFVDLGPGAIVGGLARKTLAALVRKEPAVV